MSAERRQGRDRRVVDLGPPVEGEQREQQEGSDAPMPDETARQVAGAVESVAPDAGRIAPSRRRTGAPPQQQHSPRCASEDCLPAYRDSIRLLDRGL